MTINRSLRDLLLRLVPRRWRSIVAEDIDEDAQARGRGALWRSVEIVRVAIRLRAAVALEGIRTDVVAAWRSLTRAPWFTVAAVITFALGIGASVAVLSIVDRMMFRAMPYADPDRLVQAHRLAQTNRLVLDLAITTRWRLQAETVEDVAWADGGARPAFVPGLGDAPVHIARATYNLLAVLGVRPVAGRDFDVADTRLDRRLLLLSDAAWRTRFGRSPDAIGRVFPTATMPVEIVGVLPPDFLLPSSALMARLDAIELIRDPFDRPAGDGWTATAPVARLRPGVTPGHARAELGRIAQSITDAEAPMISASVRRNPDIEVLPIRTGLLLQYRGYLRIVVMAVAAVLVLACANLSALFVSRSRSRERDFAVRAALGASRWRLIRSSAFELTLICLAGAAAAIAAMSWARSATLAVVPDIFRSFAVPPWEPRVVILVVALALAAGVLAAGVPALRFWRLDATGALRASSRSSTTAGRGAFALVAIQAALGVALVTGAAVTARNLIVMLTQPDGYRADGLVRVDLGHGMALDPPADRPGPPPVSPARLQMVDAVLRAQPGVQSAGVFSELPLFDYAGGLSNFWKGHGSERGGIWGIAPGVFTTLETPLLAGRDFTSTDVSGRARVAIVSVTGARHLWPDADARAVVGRPIVVQSGVPAPELRTVIGVVADLRPHPGAHFYPELYLPISDVAAYRGHPRVSAIVRMAGASGLSAAALDAALDDALGEGALTTTSIPEAVEAHLQRPRFQAVLFVGLATVTLILAVVGVYAAATVDAVIRRRELGIRQALGATTGQLRTAVLRTALLPVIAGSAAGLVLAWWSGGLLQALLVDVQARDPLTLTLVPLMLTSAGLLAAWLPARRAARTDPAAVLRG